MAWVGRCGFPMAREVYYRTFPVVKVQQTFYKPPLVETARCWRQEAPAGFRFALKSWQTITHPATSPTYRRAGLSVPPGEADAYGFFRPTEQVLAGWQVTQQVAAALEGRRGPLPVPWFLQAYGGERGDLRPAFRRGPALEVS